MYVHVITALMYSSHEEQFMVEVIFHSKSYERIKLVFFTILLAYLSQRMHDAFTTLSNKIMKRNILKILIL